MCVCRVVRDLYILVCMQILLHFYDVFFFKQKTAYEMRISDWSSDVCSSDLVEAAGDRRPQRIGHRLRAAGGIDDAAALRLARGDIVEGMTQGLMEGDRKRVV